MKDVTALAYCIRCRQMRVREHFSLVCQTGFRYVNGVDYPLGFECDAASCPYLGLDDFEDDGRA